MYFADIADSERSWMGPVPITTPKRTIEDCIEHRTQPDLIDQAIAQARDRGLITKSVARALSVGGSDYCCAAVLGSGHVK